MNIATFLQRSALAFGDRPAVSWGNRVQLRYRELSQRVASMAGGLRNQLHLQPGDRVALVMSNRPEYFEVLYGVWHAGLCAVPANAKLHPREFEYILANSGARICFVTSDLAETIKPLVEQVASLERIIAVGGDDYEDLLRAEGIPLHPSEWADPAWLFYTSGTTGKPKGATLTHRSLHAIVQNYFSDVDSIDPEDSVLHAAALSHASGLVGLPHVAKAANQIVPVSGGFEPEEIIELSHRYRPLTFFGAPTMLMRLVNREGGKKLALENIKTVIYGGAPMLVEDLRRAIQYFGGKLVQVFGQGEASIAATHLSKAVYANRQHPHYERILASAGLPGTGADVRIVDEEDREVPRGTVGEISLSGPFVMSGYWNDPEGTSAALRNGWLHTGDLGSFDEHGFLTIKGRAKDLIISGGSNIYAREVEDVLLTHSAVLEAAVVGRPHPDWGEEVVAFIVLRDGRTLKEAELDELCLKNIARFKRPRHYRFIETLPKNSYGKILKTALRQLLKEPEK